jgi:hypothetical protein
MDAAYRIIGWNAPEPRFPPGPLILERRLLPGKIFSGRVRINAQRPQLRR